MSRIRHLVIAVLMAGCCGDAPSHKCEFTPVKVDSGENGDADLPPGAVQCGSMVCDREETCCLRSSGQQCLSAGQSCDGLRALCDGPEDCASGAQSQGLRCCAMPSDNVATCRAPSTCPGKGIFMDGTGIVCHHDSDCPPERPSCVRIQIADGELRTCS